jgi:two-component system phosphate regulon response regulator PhoB
MRTYSMPVAGWQAGHEPAAWWNSQREGTVRHDDIAQPAVKTVLVVDDDRDICEMLGHILRAAGFAVAMEVDGERGLSTARRLQPDLVLLDWMLPNVTGIDICRRLREDPATAATRVIMVTARAETADMARSLAAGADDHIVKPFGRRELIRRIRTALEP